MNGALKTQADVLDSLDQYTKYYDIKNTHPYNELDVSTDPTGKVTAAQAQLDQNIIAAGGSVGQIFGSALGRALAPNNQFAQLAIGTVAGLIGQKLVQNFAASLTSDASRFVAGDFASVTGLDVANAGLGAIASFLTAELGTELHLTGFGAQLFNAGAGGVTGSVLTQVATKVATGASFDAAIGAINWSTAATQAGYNISAAFGSYLAHEFAPAESHQGAVGGQLFGAVGSAIGILFGQGLGTVLNFLMPGLGSFFGTIIGTLLGDAFAGDPANPKATHDVEILGNDTHFQNRLVGTDDHGNAAISKQMGDQVTAIANSYLDAVHGAAIDHRGHVMIGYNSGAAPYPYIAGWFPDGSGPVAHFAATTDAIQEGVRELLMQTEVIGGDLLIKRAHQAFISGAHADPNVDPSNFTDLIALSGNLSVAQDYENYLNNREAINALIAANPDTAFSAGWIATFARVNDLKLNQYVASDFLGGLVGYLDSVAKAGIAFDAAGASVSHSGAGVTVGIKVPNGVDIPGALSVFANQTSQSSDATGTTVQLTFTDGLAAGGFHALAAGSTSGDGGNDLWFGPDAGTGFVGTGGNDILIGGGGPDTILGGDGWDFIDAGAGGGQLFGQGGNDILRGGSGNDALYGGAGNDTYAFNRGGGADIALDEVNVTTTTTVLQSGFYDADGDGINEFHQDWVTTTTTDHPDAGNDTLAFGPGIALSDIRVRQSGNDLIVGVGDPAHPGAPSTDQVTLQHWFDDPKDRIENFRFADGTTLNLAAGQPALTPLEIPFGAALAGGSVAENSANGTVVGTLTGFDFDANAALSYSLIDNAGGRFSINPSTGVIAVAALLDYEAAHAWQVTARTADQSGHVFDKVLTIAVADVNEAPVNAILAGNSVAENSANGTVVGTVTGTDPDAGAVLHYSLTGNAGGRFAIDASTGAISVANGALLDYEQAGAHSIVVRTTDQSGLFLDKAFAITVTDIVNDFNAGFHGDVLLRRRDLYRICHHRVHSNEVRVIGSSGEWASQTQNFIGSRANKLQRNTALAC